MTISAYPLQWPAGWGRTGAGLRKTTAFKRLGRAITVAEAVERVREELRRMGHGDNDVVVSTNIELRLDGWPRSDRPEPADRGAAVYWREKSGATRCMAIDRYDRVAGNLAAIAATLEAMRAIERHGGAEILDRAFTGFVALPAAEKPWHIVLGVPHHAATPDVEQAYRRARGRAHPDTGGSAALFDEIQRAWTAFRQERRLP